VTRLAPTRRIPRWSDRAAVAQFVADEMDDLRLEVDRIAWTYTGPGEMPDDTPDDVVAMLPRSTGEHAVLVVDRGGGSSRRCGAAGRPLAVRRDARAVPLWGCAASAAQQLQQFNPG